MNAWWMALMRRGRWAAFVAMAMLIGSEGGPLLGRQPVADTVWQPVGAAFRPAGLAARIDSGQAVVMRFDQLAFDGFMNAAPAETAMRSAAPLVLSLPRPDGSLSRFAIAESPILAPELAAAYPEIRTFTGQGLDDPTATTRFGWTAAGFHAIVVASSGTTYIDPVAPGDLELYQVAGKAGRPQPENPFICLLNGTGEEVGQRIAGEFPITNGTSLRTYRLALAATVEYTTAAGGTKAAALARMVATLNRVNGIYERELAVRMTLATGSSDDSTELIYDSAPDPYTNNDGVTMLAENQTNITNVVGAANYDVGHVFSTGGGGVATLRSPCTDNIKARGVTGSSSPTGDAFDVDYVAHEMGHQFGGNHTFNSNISSCEDNRSGTHAFEVGSGSTIQAYAGICSPENLQPNSNDYFHFESLNEMTAFITNAATGGSCGTASATGNTVPTVSATAAFTIPASTPFKLTATGADANNDAITYAWEEYDLGTASIDVATATTDAGNRPLFRSYSPSTSPSRTFPSLTYILNHANAPPTTYSCSGGPCLTGETLPTTNRTMNFHVTVRDNRAGGGGIITAPTAITVSAAAGPFQVTAPNTALSLTGGSAQTVTWNAASTAAAPVNTANVRILLSTDGGTTFGTELLASTPNDGSQNVTLPNITTTTARIKVEAVGNVFFDISNTNFSITATPTITGAPATLAFTAIKDGSAGAIVSVTAPQSVAVTYAGGTAPAWTATANQPWVLITNGSGTGTGTFTVAISDAGNVIAGSTSLTATITIASASPTRTSTVALSLTVKQTGTSLLPFGSFDTPIAGAAVEGSIAVTGWALDDVEVAKVEIWRDLVAGETTIPYPGPGPGTGKVYIADPVFVTGARPDVEALNSTLPLANRAGWGYLMLTRGLWNQGNGPFTLYAFAYDREGRSAVLGSRTITVNNAAAVRPFGSIDVPAYGQTMTASFFNFGWALTPNATPVCSVSTVQVSIDSGPLQPVNYGDERPDIAAAFPGFSDGAGAGGAYYIDISTLANGSHLIGWYVVDSCNRAEGIGSRFFTVLAASSDVPLPARPTVTAADAVRQVIDQPVIVRRGLDAVPVEATADGDHLVTISQDERIEVELPATGGAPYVGYQIVNGTRRALPEGSTLDGATGVFYWQPAAGFLGTFDLEFVAATGGVVRVQVTVAPPQ